MLIYDTSIFIVFLLTVAGIIAAASHNSYVKKSIIALMTALTIFFIYFVIVMKGEPIRGYPKINVEYEYVWHEGRMIDGKKFIVLWTKKDGLDRLYIFPYNRNVAQKLSQLKNRKKKTGERSSLKFLKEKKIKKKGRNTENSIKVETKKRVKKYPGLTKGE